MGFSRQEYCSGLLFPSPGDLPNPGIEPRSPTLQADSLPAEPQGKPKDTGVCNLSLLQWIFSTQESNQDLLHCRRIFYQLSYQESPTIELVRHKIHFLLHITIWLKNGTLFHKIREDDASKQFFYFQSAQKAHTCQIFSPFQFASNAKWPQNGQCWVLRQLLM